MTGSSATRVDRLTRLIESKCGIAQTDSNGRGFEGVVMRVRTRLSLGAVAAVATLGATSARQASVFVVTVGDLHGGALIADAQIRLRPRAAMGRAQ